MEPLWLLSILQKNKLKKYYYILYQVVSSKQQVVPGAGMSTGLGASSPFGIGGYEVVNHPQYMSAISSAVDPDKM